MHFFSITTRTLHFCWEILKCSRMTKSLYLFTFLLLMKYFHLSVIHFVTPALNGLEINARNTLKVFVYFCYVQSSFVNMTDFLQDLHERHERLKKRIHSFRIPLSPTGQKIMGFVYFCIPVVCGYYLMEVNFTYSKYRLHRIVF